MAGRARRSYSVSSAYPPNSNPSLYLSPPRSSGDHTFSINADIPLPYPPGSSSLSDVTKLQQFSSLSVSVAQRRNSTAALRRKYEDLEQKLEATPLWVLVSTYLNYLILILYGHLRDILGKVFKRDEYAHLRTHDGYAPLVSDFDSFYTRRLYMRIRLSGTTTEAVNFASYNYLGFAQSVGECADAVEETVKTLGACSSSPRSEAGGSSLHRQLEGKVAQFVGKPAAIVVSMGFATNSTTIPTLVRKGCLIISDELNHSSIIFGARLSGASIRVFKHNNMDSLKLLLQEVISQGQPRTHRPWKKIMVIVEGLYSMEGSIVNLPALVQLRKQFGFYLYVDEAHSIGALGERGGGVCDFYGISPSHVDILMGTFTKSFGAAGGYIAATKDIIDYLRLKNHSFAYAESITPPVAQQILTSITIIRGDDGTNEGRKRIQQLADNSVYFAARLREMGFIVYGDEGSPVIPLLVFNPAKIPAFSRELLQRKIAICVVGYPATPIITARARFCVSASHTRKDLDYALEHISEIGDTLMLKVSRAARKKLE
ncbi:pyridoxal phosphate-dependent transferase [Umbelopsis sp. AD052]|nr:pyridoxal phosphate-dependent transferase [Umbelopsis sp. AD052]